MEYAGNTCSGVRAEIGYSRASRRLDWKMCSPTQSFSRLTMRSRGSSSAPPSQPHAAISEAGPAASPSRRKSRRFTPPCSAMAGEPPPIPTRDHRPERRGIHQQDEGDVQQGERDEDPDRPEVPVARQLVSAEQRREPGELHRLVDGEPGEGRKRPKQHDGGVGPFLQCVVLALRRMLAPEAKIVELHLDGRPDVAGAE